MIAVMAIGCVQILGIEQLPLSTTATDASSSADSASDSATICDKLDPDPCRPGCKLPFCADFEIAPLERGWSSYGGLANPILFTKGADSSSKATRAASARGGNALETDVVSVGSWSLAGLTHSFSWPPNASGVEIATDFLLEERSFITDAGAAELALVFGLISEDATTGELAGAAIGVSSTDIYVASIGNLLSSPSISSEVNLTDRIDIGIIGRWTRLLLYVGTAESAQRQGYRGCPSTGWVFAAYFVTGSRCIAAPARSGAPFDKAFFEKNPTLLTGTGARSPGRIKAQYDNVHLRTVL
jgi:hypothetical protein